MVALLCLVVAQFTLYAVVLAPGFVQDDYCWIETAVRSRDDPGAVFSRFISGFFRPVVHLVFLANYELGGMRPWTYSLVNVLLESCVTFGMAWLAYRLTRNGGAALIGAIVFASHPSHGEVVGWISARTTSLWTLLALLSLAGWIRWRETRRRGYACALVAFGLALLTKEEAPVVLPILIVMDRLLTRRAGGLIPLDNRQARWSGWAYAPFLVILGGYLLLQYRFQSTNPLFREGRYALDAAGLAKCLARLPGLFVWKGVVRAPWLHLAFFVEAAFAVLVLRRSSPLLRRVAVFGLAFGLLALLPSSFFLTHQAARYAYAATLGSSLAWTALVASLPSQGRGRAVIRIGMCLLIGVTIAGQIHHLKQKVAYWSEQGRSGQTLLAAAQHVAPLVHEAAASNKSVCLLDPPMHLPHLRSLLWLVGAVGPEQVLASPSSDGRSSTCPPDAVRLRWEPRSGVFLLCAERGGTVPDCPPRG